MLSLVHADFLPPLYAVSEVLRAGGYQIDLFSCSSPASGQVRLSDGVTFHDCGRHAGSALRRRAVRRRFMSRVQDWAPVYTPAVIFATCPFSFLLGLRVAGNAAPVIYLAFETYDVRLSDCWRSPATALRKWMALRALPRAGLVCVPSEGRADWLLRRARLSARPTVVLNAPHGGATSPSQADIETTRHRFLPSPLLSKQLVIHTGNVSTTQAVLELVESVVYWPATAALIVTRVGDSRYEKAVRAAAVKSPRARDIVLVPMVSRADMLLLQSLSAVGVCLLRAGVNLSADLPAPNKVGEYLHASLVIVGTQSEYMSALATRGVAVLTSSLAPVDIGQAVQQALAISRTGAAKAAVEKVVRSWYNMEVQMRPVLEYLDGRDGRRHRR